jgi:iron complex transport system substrate-binding protein
MPLLRRFRGLAAALCALAPLAAHGATITDSAGRTVTIPDRVGRVFAAGAPASVLIYVLKPGALLGWPRRVRPEEAPYIATPYRDLPETGRLTGRGGDAKLQALLKSKPDLIVDFGSVRPTYVSLADRVQDQTRIPYILVNGRFEHTAAALRLAGKALGVAQRGEALARWTEKLFADLDAALGVVPQAKRPLVYMARGPDGLETGLSGSINTEIIERAGGRNVAAPLDARRGLARVSIEQVIVGNPDTIITWDRNFYRRVRNDPLWSGIEALKRGRVYRSPTAPFGWIDRPPSLNRLMGLRWLAGLFYPDRFPVKLRQAAREFYKLFYQVDISDADLDRLIQWASGQAPG